MTGLRRHLPDLLPVALLALALQVFAGWLVPVLAGAERGRLCVAHATGAAVFDTDPTGAPPLPPSDDRAHACCFAGCLTGGPLDLTVVAAPATPLPRSPARFATSFDDRIRGAERPMPFAARAPPLAFA